MRGVGCRRSCCGQHLITMSLSIPVCAVLDNVETASVRVAGGLDNVAGACLAPHLCKEPHHRSSARRVTAAHVDACPDYHPLFDQPAGVKIPKFSTFVVPGDSKMDLTGTAPMRMAWLLSSATLNALCRLCLHVASAGA